MPLASDILGVESGPFVTENVAKTALNDVIMLINAADWKIGTLTVTPTGAETLPTAGAIIIEQSNDPAYAGTWFPCVAWDAASTNTSASAIGPLAVTAALSRSFTPVMQWVRIRITTAFTARPASPFLRLYLEEDASFIPGLAGDGRSLVTGNASEDTAAIGAPVMVAGMVRTANLTTLVAGDVARHTSTTSAQFLVKEGHLPELDWSYAVVVGGIVNTTDVVAKAAAGAGLRNYIYSMQIKNANAVAGEFVIKDGATIIWRGHLAASMVDGHEIQFRPPLKGTANTAVNIACITAGQQVYANLQGGVGV